MKKLLTLGLVAFSAVLLAGCSSSTPTDEAVAPVIEAPVVEAPVVETPVIEMTGAETPVAEAPVVEMTGEVATGN